MSKIKISKIEIKINKTTLELSLDDARALFNELNQVFGPTHVHRPWTINDVSLPYIQTNENDFPLSGTTIGDAQSIHDHWKNHSLD